MKDINIFIKHIKLNLSDLKITKKSLLDGINHELEHGKINNLTNVTNDDLIITGKIALAHLLENPKYYILLNKCVEVDLDSDADVEGSGPYQTAANIYRKFFCNGKARSLLDGEYHYGCHSFTGPGTRIDLSEVRNFKPYNNIDACSKQHDIDYLNAHGDPNLIRKADIDVVNCYNKYPNDNGYNVAKLGINSKMKLEDALPLLSKAIAPNYFGRN